MAPIEKVSTLSSATPVPPQLLWLARAVLWVTVVGLLLLAAALVLGEEEPRGSNAWLLAHGVHPIWLAGYSAIAAILLLAFGRRLRLNRLLDFMIYGVLTSPYPLFCILSSAYIIDTQQGARAAIVVYGIGYAFFYLSTAFATLLLTWISLTQGRKP